MAHPFRAAPTVVSVTAVAVIAAAASWTVYARHDAPSSSPPRPPTSLGHIAAVSLTTAHDCSDLLKYYRQQADQVVGPYGLDDGSIFASGGIASAARTMGGLPVPGAVAEPASGKAASSIPDTSTNVQVAGVDESDTVKTSGDLMISATDGAVRVTRLDGAKTKNLATWRPLEGSVEAILLDGGTTSGIDSGVAASGSSATSAPSTTSTGASPLTAVVVGDTGPQLGRMETDERVMGPTGVGGNVTVLTVLNLSDPAHPRPVRRLEITGTRSGDVRMVDGELRLAVTAESNGLAWHQPVYGSGNGAAAQYLKAEKRSTAANRKLIAHSTIDNWIPETTVTELTSTGRSTGVSAKRPLLDCAQVAVPNSFSGLQTLAMVSVGLRAGTPLANWQAAGVIAAGSTLYATADHAWVATARWDRPVRRKDALKGADLRFAPTSGSTQIHLFDTALGTAPKYVASAEIKGTLLNQFAMDERAGVLRVASTTQAGMTDTDTGTDPPAASPSTEPQPKPTGTANDQALAKIAVEVGAAPTSSDAGQGASRYQPSEARVSTLKLDGDRLTQVGVLTGLGSGEQIRGVRFDGDIGYVVTYRQTDPLYTVDLSDPAHPTLRGELKMPGYSAYLHPVGAGRVLGLGQDGTTDGQTTGLSLSLFDVTDLTAPKRLDRQGLKGAWSDAEADHHAFTLAGDLVLVPYTVWNWAVPTPSAGGASDTRQFDAGVIAVRMNAAHDSLSKPVVLRPMTTAPTRMAVDTPKAQRRFEQAIGATPSRVVVHAGVIYTLTPVGVAAHDATSFAHLTFAHF